MSNANLSGPDKPQTRALTPVNQVIATIETPDFRNQLAVMLPPHVKLDNFLAVARRGILNNKALNFEKMNKSTLYASCLKAAEQGLKLDGEEAALVQYGDSVQFMKMIKGVKKQLRNSGEIKDITAEVIYKNDKFSYWVDDEGKHIKHEPNFMEERGEMVAAYSVITTKDGGKFIKVMGKNEILAVKSASKTGSASFSPWNGPFASEMWCKTVLRRNAKDAPSSTDLSESFKEAFKEWDEDFDFSGGGNTQAAQNAQASDSSPAEVKKSTARTGSRLDAVIKKTADKNLVDNENQLEKNQDSINRDDSDQDAEFIDIIPGGAAPTQAALAPDQIPL